MSRSITEEVAMKFILTIKLGNDAIRTGDDVAAVLRDVADRIEGDVTAEVAAHDVPVTLRDRNSNKIGTCTVAP